MPTSKSLAAPSHRSLIEQVQGSMRSAGRRLATGVDLVDALRRRDLARMMIFLGEFKRG